MENLTLHDIYVLIQNELKAPKNQFNAFGKYKYRSCEDIYEGVKPLLNKYNVTLKVIDEVVLIGERYYIKATAILSSGKETVSTTAYAREEENKRGMDSAQITGAASSYAKKYALNGLFCIDDTRDPDSTNDHKEEVIDEKQLHSLRDQLIELNISEEKFCKYMKIDSMEKMLNSDYKKATEALEAKRKKVSNGDN